MNIGPVRRVVTACVIVAALTPAVGIAKPIPGSGIAISSREFLVATVHTSRYHYCIAAWRGSQPEDQSRVRVIVHRMQWATGETVMEDTTVAEHSLRLTESAGYRTMRFAASLPVMGEFDMTMGSWRDRLEHWIDPLIMFVGESASETYDGASNQTAGGAVTSWLDAVWGIRGHGIVHMR